MESEIIDAARLARRLAFLSLGGCLATGIALCHAQGQPAPAVPGGQAEMSLRKAVTAREFRGRQFAGEERQVVPGDSVWRILVEEKGLPERRFHSYLVLIRGLNPQLKSLDVLRVGDRLFIPLRMDEGEPMPPRTTTTAAATVDYRVRSGDHIYRILREQLKISDERKLAEYYALVKDLNPERKDWNNLFRDEVIRLPVPDPRSTAKTDSVTPKAEAGTAKRETKAVTPLADARKPVPSPSSEVGGVPESAGPVPFAPAAAPATVEQTIRLPARDNLRLFTRVAEALGNQIQQSGEEIVKLPDGAVRFDRSSYPVVYNGALQQRVVIDPGGNIPASLKTRLSDPSIGMAVLPMADGLSLYDAVRHLLVGLGYQPLPTEKPIVVQEAGIAFEAKGNWMALAPEVSNKTQEIVVIHIAEAPGAVPEYLATSLARHGLSLREIALTPPAGEPRLTKISRDLDSTATSARHLPVDKREVVDALLSSFEVVFGVAEDISIELGAGLRVEKRADRVFELSGKRTAIFFGRVDPAIRQALQDRHGIRAVELEIDALESRDIIGRIFSLLGDQAAYREHRFPVAGPAPQPLTVKAWGFHVPRKAMFLTDRQIPTPLQRFFFEQGLEIVYFR